MLAEPSVVRPDDDPQLGVELLGAQRGVEVGEIVPADHRRCAGRRNARLAERGVGELGALEYGHPRNRGDSRSAVLQSAREDDDDRFVVAVREFSDEAVGQRSVAADDEMVPRGEVRGGRGHGLDDIAPMILKIGLVVWKGPASEGKSAHGQ